MFSPKIENRHPRGICYRICKPVGSLESRLYGQKRSTCFIRKGARKKNPSSSKLTNEDLTPHSMRTNRQYCLFMFFGFFFLSFKPGWLCWLHIYNTYPYCTSDRVRCDNGYKVTDMMYVLQITSFFFSPPKRLRHWCTIFLHKSLSASLFTKCTLIRFQKGRKRPL